MGLIWFIVEIFLANVEVDMHSNARAQIGINPFDFAWNLEAGDEFQTPEAVMVYSPNGLTGMSHIIHDYIERDYVGNS